MGMALPLAQKYSTYGHNNQRSSTAYRKKGTTTMTPTRTNKPPGIFSKTQTAAQRKICSMRQIPKPAELNYEGMGK